MPEDFDPTDLLNTTTLNYPGMPQQAPPEMVPGVPASPQPSFQDQFEQKILQQLGMTKEDYIKKELQKTQGTKTKKVLNGISDVLGVLGSTRDKPFETSVGRADRAGTAEYEKLQPQLRQEANEIYKNKTSEANAQTRAGATTGAAQIRANASETNAKGAQEIARILADAKAKNLDAKTAGEKELSKRKQDSYDALSKVVPGFDLLSKDAKDLISDKYIKSQMGDTFLDDLKTMGQVKDVTNPTRERALFSLDGPAWDKYKSHDADLNKNKLLGTRAPLPRAGSNPNKVAGEDMYMQYNPETKQMEATKVQRSSTPGLFFSPLTGMRQDMSKMQPFDAKVMATDNATATGINQAYEGINNLLKIASAPKGSAQSKVLGPLYGNALATGLRSISDAGQTFEELNKNISASNVALQHTKSLVGGRPPAQIVADMKNLTGKQWQDPSTQLRAMASMLYSIQNIQLTNRKDPKSAKLNDPRIVGKLDDAIKEFIGQAKKSQAAGQSNSVPFDALQVKPLKSLEDILDELGTNDKMTPESAKKSLRDEVGLP